MTAFFLIGLFCLGVVLLGFLYCADDMMEKR